MGGKCTYKLEPVVADGGELIIYAPHITRISATHGVLIERIGYHVRDYFLAQMGRFTDVPGGVLAHSTHVKGLGTYVNGREQPRANVVLATGIPEATCRKINLGYRDPGLHRPGGVARPGSGRVAARAEVRRDAVPAARRPVRPRAGRGVSGGP